MQYRDSRNFYNRRNERYNRYIPREYERNSHARWNSGYKRQFGSYKDNKPSLTSRILASLFKLGGRFREKYQKEEPKKSKNVVYDDTEKLTTYETARFNPEINASESNLDGEHNNE